MKEYEPWIARVKATKLNGRKGPGMEYEVIRYLYTDEVFTVVKEEGNWLQAKMGYWVHKNYVEYVRKA